MPYNGCMKKISLDSIVFVALAAVYVGLNGWAFGQYAPFVHRSDSVFYIEQAAYSGLDLIDDNRAFSTALLYKLYGTGYPDYDAERITRAQLVFSVLAWLFFAGALAWALRQRAAKFLAFVAVLGFSLIPAIFVYHRALLSESTSSSLFALVLGVWVLVLRRRPIDKREQVAWALALALALLLFAHTRDTNAYLLLGVGGLGLLPLWRLPAQRLFWGVVVVVCVGNFFVQDSIANRNQRWQYPLMNVVVNRVLPDADKTAFFVERGMPMNADVMRFAGLEFTSAGGDWQAVFGDWLNTGGAKGTYMRFLLSRPLEHLWQPVENYTPLLKPYYFTYTHRYDNPPLLAMLERAFYLPTGFWLLALLFGAGWLLLQARRPQRLGLWVLPLVLLLSIFPHMFVVWHGDAIEVDRHAAAVTWHLRLGVLLALLLGADAAVRAPSFKKKWLPAPRRVAGVVAGLALLQVLFSWGGFQVGIALPIATRLAPNTNMLAPWGVSALQYRAFADDLRGRLPADALVVSPHSDPDGLTTTFSPAEWRFSRERAADFNASRYLRQWRESLQPRYLEDLGAGYVYVHADWWNQQGEFVRALFADPANYELLTTGHNATRLYRVVNRAEAAALGGATLGLSAANFARYQEHAQNKPIVPAGAVIFNPASGLEWFETTAEIGRYVQALGLQGEPLLLLFDLMQIWEAVQFEADLRLNPAQQNALAQWRTTKEPRYLQQAGIDYLFYNDLWETYTTQEEYDLLRYSGGYVLQRTWDDNIPGFYVLFAVGR